jgi:glutamate/tyrosine decarboxylase-like PLP-dependent enzyme
MNSDLILSLLPDSLRRLSAWQSQWHSYDTDETLQVSEPLAREVLGELIDRLADNYPFWHPSYAGQMLKPPHDIASLAYFLAQQINPNNHALDGGPATARMEIEVVARLAGMFGFIAHLGHLTSSGTIANLEALWVARNLHPDKAIAFSTDAHYTHKRMCEVIGAQSVEIATNHRGQMNLQDLREKLRTGKIGTVVLTSGTTPLGAVDAIAEAVALQSEFAFRIHVDGAYGGFFRLLASDKLLNDSDADAFRAIAQCDSVVVDPHKHGLQPYGCGCVLFSDPNIGRFYKHDSPYTYFTSDDLHLGEISLECSRAGAAAAALWATLKCFPLRGSEKGLGAVLRKTRLAALEWAKLIEQSNELKLVTEPSLDIVAFFPWLRGKRVSDISEVVNQVFASLMNDKQHPIYLAKLHVKPQMLAQYPDLIWDAPTMTVFRSVLMKPEHLRYVPQLHQHVLEAIRK